MVDPIDKIAGALGLGLDTTLGEGIGLAICYSQKVRWMQLDVPAISLFQNQNHVANRGETGKTLFLIQSLRFSVRILVQDLYYSERINHDLLDTRIDVQLPHFCQFFYLHPFGTKGRMHKKLCLAVLTPCRSWLVLGICMLTVTFWIKSSFIDNKSSRYSYNIAFIGKSA